ncbi:MULTISPECIES: phosphomannomutase/phosphoglucomutase [unclassified Frigoribacterium]|uniref:phosphomannomutase/phosphoglucomutase n=1 Tax=unclassified Frigoribacterium TaxID=2627005 RepID=UPI0006F9E2BB|nr:MULTISPECIES: phosphomannomutase/phosphoglucomutase [unclassified Frigoribacterium]KQO46624.1 phosphoglucosamine mutase [Frigoribacterium sp. Leaf254]KQT38717.1 phosphoglucosamine mutase [Frigoribacterium sp. Leaf415]
MTSENTPVDLTAFVKTYDVRGLVGSQLTGEVVEAFGAAFADEIDGAGRDLVVGHDMRDSSPGFADAFARGARARGANVVALGLCSTDESYFASGSLDAPAAMFTASHNPATYNGIKMSRAGAQGISLDTGLSSIRDRASSFLADGIEAVAETGTVREHDALPDYAAYLRGLVDLSGIRPITVVVDAGNGMGGLTVPAVLGEAAGLPKLPIEIIPLYFELDGTFPNHEANPLDPANLVDLQKAVLEHGADLGLAFDGDADRCFVVDEKGDAVTPSAVAAIVAVREIARVRAAEPDAEISVIHNLITSRAVPEAIEAAGATPVRTRVGHSLIKDEMRSTGAIFGGEHSAHYYFRDFWSADNGMLAAMHVLAEFGAQTEPLSTLTDRYTPYSASGEINSTVTDVPAAYARIVEAYAGVGDFDELDGLTVSGTSDDGFWWFNVRPSNTEPLLRLNAEAATPAGMERVRDDVLGLIRG